MLFLAQLCWEFQSFLEALYLKTMLRIFSTLFLYQCTSLILSRSLYLCTTRVKTCEFCPDRYFKHKLDRWGSRYRGQNTALKGVLPPWMPVLDLRGGSRRNWKNGDAKEPWNVPKYSQNVKNALKCPEISSNAPKYLKIPQNTPANTWPGNTEIEGVAPNPPISRT